MILFILSLGAFTLVLVIVNIVVVCQLVEHRDLTIELHVDILVQIGLGLLREL